MAKYTFICEQESAPYADIVESKRTFEFHADGLDQILSEFESFLRGSGFYFNGNIDIVEEESYEEHRQESDFDFSNIPQNNWLFGDLKPQSSASDDLIESIDISNSETIELNLDYGAAQPALHLYDEMDYPSVSFPKSNR